MPSVPGDRPAAADGAETTAGQVLRFFAHQARKVQYRHGGAGLPAVAQRPAPQLHGRLVHQAGSGANTRVLARGLGGLPIKK